jgi:hypothetical protein
LSLQSGEIDRASLVAEGRSGWERRLGPRARAFVSAPPRWWSWLALAVLLLAGAALLIYETRGTFFWADEWQWILTRRGGGLNTFLQPHNQHFSLVPITLYKLLFAIVGLRHYWPYRGLLIGVEVICTLLIFLYARQRVGSYYALLAAALILFFGPGWQDILWPFQTAWILCVLGGVGALLALDRHDRAGDIGACLLLGLSLASSSPGLAVAAGLMVEVLLARRRRDLWIVAIPVALYALWWVTYQQTVFNRHALLLLPQFVFNSAAGTLSALTGLAQINPYNDGSGDFLSWGAPLLVLALALAIWRLRVLRRIPPRVLTLSTILLAFWLLTGVGRAYVSVGSLTLTSTGDESRYLFIGAVFVVLLIVELANRRAIARPAMAAGIGVLAAAAILSNLGPLQAGAGLLQSQAQYTEAELGTLNLSRPIVAPGYVSQGFIFGIVKARDWFAAEKALGAPPLSPALLAQQPEFARQAADSQLVRIQNLAPRGTSTSTPPGATPPSVDAVASGTDSVSSGCVSFRPTAYTPSGVVNSLTVTAAPGGLLVRSGAAEATVSVRRFGSQFLTLGTVAPGAGATLVIKPDLAPQPWHAQVTAASSFSVCSLG